MPTIASLDFHQKRDIPLPQTNSFHGIELDDPPRHQTSPSLLDHRHQLILTTQDPFRKLCNILFNEQSRGLEASARAKVDVVLIQELDLEWRFVPKGCSKTRFLYQSTSQEAGMSILNNHQTLLSLEDTPSKTDSTDGLDLTRRSRRSEQRRGGRTGGGEVTGR